MKGEKEEVGEDNTEEILKRKKKHAFPHSTGRRGTGADEEEDKGLHRLWVAVLVSASKKL